MKSIQYLLFFLSIILIIILKIGGKASGKATYRIGYLIFVCVFIFAVASPDSVMQIANSLDVGRGTDLLVYLTSFALISLSLIMILKFARAEKELTKLVRIYAIENSRKPRSRK